MINSRRPDRGRTATISKDAQNFLFAMSNDSTYSEENISNNEAKTFFIVPNQQNYLLMLSKSLNWFELSVSVVGLLVNGLVIAAIAFGRTMTSRGYFFGLLNLSVAQSSICLTSITSGMVSLIGSGNNTFLLSNEGMQPLCISICMVLNLFTLLKKIVRAAGQGNSSAVFSKGELLKQVLHNIFVAILAILPTGYAAMSFIQWWSSNIFVNHYQLPSGLRIGQGLSQLLSVIVYYTFNLSPYMFFPVQLLFVCYGQHHCYLPFG